MNLNISAQFLNIVQELNSSKGNVENSNKFLVIFDELQGTDELKNVDTENDESINLELLQGMINNIMKVDLKKISDDESFKSLDISNSKDINLEYKDKILLESILEDINSKNLLFSNPKIDTNNMEQLATKETLKEEPISDTRQEFIQEDIVKAIKYLKANKLDEINIKINPKSLGNMDIKLKKNTDDTSVLIMINKEETFDIVNEIIQDVTKYLEDKDTSEKDISVLENILGDGNSNDLLFSSSNININSVEKLGTKTTLNQEPVTYIRKEFMQEDIVQTIKYIKSNNLEEMNIKVSPRELGNINIKLVKDTNDTSILITIGKEETFDMVNKNIQDITKHLESLNIKVKELNVYIKNDNQNFFLGNLNQEFNKKDQKFNKKNQYKNIEMEDLEDIKEIDNLENNINILI